VWSRTSVVGINAVAPTLRVVGVERTQAIQFFLSNGQGSGGGTDNSVPLVGEKPMVLRVYVDRVAPAGQPGPTTVAGTLTGLGPAALLPINGPIPARSATLINRGNVNETLNFWVSPTLCSGTKSFNITVTDPAQPNNPASTSVPATASITFDSVPRPRVQGVLIRYTGMGLNIAAPTGQQLMRTLDFVSEVYPISGFDFRGFTVIDFNGNLQAPGGGGCGTGWNELFEIIANLKSTSSNSTDTFVAVLPPGVPTGGVIGCGGGGVAIGREGDGATFAQEIGHAFGRNHAPCGSPGGVDMNYPTYDAYPAASIGEFGFSTSGLTVLDPATTFDFMSYCAPVWVSPYTYVGLKTAISAAPAASSAQRAEVHEFVSDCLYLNFRVHFDGAVELLPSYVLEGGTVGVDLREPSDIWLHLLGPEDAVVATHRCHLRDPHQSPDKIYMDFHESVVWDPTVEGLAVYRDKERLAVLDLGAEPPQVRVNQPVPMEDQENVVRLDWRTGRRAEAPRLTYLIRYTCDDGRGWVAVAADLTESPFLVDLSTLPGGDECRFQVLASTGIRTTHAETESFAVPRKPARAFILAPLDGEHTGSAEPLLLSGVGYSPESGTTSPEGGVWTSDRDGELGRGKQVLVQGLTPGRHQLSLTVPDGLGHDTEASISIVVQALR
jgi:hypothetical protein